MGGELSLEKGIFVKFKRREKNAGAFDRRTTFSRTLQLMFLFLPHQHQQLSFITSQTGIVKNLGDCCLLFSWLLKGFLELVI